MSEHSILSKYPAYEATIGIEVHVQLSTKSKIFCTCSNDTSNEANQNICQVCCGYPGVLPVLNQQVVNYAIMAGLATNCTINQQNEFARKHYFYPDLPKNYQITQSDKPVCSNGFITITLENGTSKNIRLIRIHIEEDAGKNIHAPYSDESFVDLNRTGTPLLEVVTHPDISNAFEARAYLKALRAIVMYLNICSGNMEEGAFRADTNISVRKKGAAQLGTRCELKNINSFKFIADAIEYEIERQILLLESGKKVIQETRLWDTKEHKTVMMRSKEEAADYRYFPDPDLPPLFIDQAWINRIKGNLPELPQQKFERLCTTGGLTAYEAEILINEPEIAHYYEQSRMATTSPLLINWILRDVMGYLKEHKITLTDFKITPALLAELMDLIDQKVINARTAQEVFIHAAQTGQSPKGIVKEQNLEQMSDTSEIEKIIQEIIQKNPQQAADYKAGKEKLFGFFVGQVMAKTKGKGDPQLINELLKRYLSN
ncbi:MAG: Asp-tRNA(Asn)/Glu-tRNA(Gln) amidotransferase subunit GatB [Candidatus Babeliaceae bacterium]